MWVLVNNLPEKIQVVLNDLHIIKYYKIYDMRNRYIGNAKKEDIENSYLKENGNTWVKKSC